MTIAPLSIWQALLFFGLPALLFRLSLYNGIPAMVGLGVSPFDASIAAVAVPSSILFALAFGFSSRDGYGSWGSLKTRVRLQRMTGRDWLWAIGGLILTFLSIGVLLPTARLLIGAIPAIAPPEFFPPWLKAGTNFDVALFASYIGAPVKGNWGVAGLFVFMLFFNIFGEELWWRGYILPRQERAQGRGAWAVNGLLWWLWHLAFYPWQVVALLPICVVLPYIAQRRGSTWVAIIVHLQNAAVLVLVLLMVLGVA